MEIQGLDNIEKILFNIKKKTKYHLRNLFLTWLYDLLESSLNMLVLTICQNSVAFHCL